MALELKVIVADGGKLPAYATDGAAGLDLCAAEDVELQPLDRALVPTGLKIAVPPGYEAQVRPRSGLALKHGLAIVNSPGTIDSDYRGEIGILLINLGSQAVKLLKGERVAQMVVTPVARVSVVQVDDLDDTERGEGGFGSTGTQSL